MIDRTRLLRWSAAAVLLLTLALIALRALLPVGGLAVFANAAGVYERKVASPAVLRTRLHAPAGFSVALYADELPGARMLHATAAGDLLLSQPQAGRIMLLGRDANGDGAPDRREVLLDGLERPHGIDIHDGWLYVAEGGAVGRVRFDAAAGRVQGAYARIVNGIPAGGNHWRRTLRAAPDGWIYVNVGSSCNVCIEQDPMRATIVRFRADGSGLEVHARGLRNSSGFDFAPWDGALYATDHGRDLLGDDVPPCELNRIVAGGFYGWPYVNGFGDADPDFGTQGGAAAAGALPPVHGFRAHNAPVGIHFLRHATHTARFGRAALVALHGSWNRSRPDGYAVVLLQWQADGRVQEQEFLGGFEQDGDVIGRPVDIAEATDGMLYVSDDYAGAIYRVSRTGS